MNSESAAIVDSVELVVRDSQGRIKAARFIKHGREFIPNHRFIAALNKGRQPWKIPIVYGTWHRVPQES